MSDWKSVKVPSGAKLFKVHNFNLMVKGSHFNIEVDEFQDGTFTAHGEHSTDKNSVFEPVNAKTLEDALSAIVAKIQTRG